MTDNFRFLLLSAMYENGGNTTHRLLDGHPQMFVYPFESQLGTRLVSDMLTSVFPVKYRWPVFDSRLRPPRITTRSSTKSASPRANPRGEQVPRHAVRFL